MATFTDDWDTDRSSDSTNATQIDDYINKLATDAEERLKNWVYGFVAGENDGIGGLIYGKFKVQTSVTQIANTILLYGKDVSDKCELHAIDEDGDEIQMTEGGKMLIGCGTASQALMHNTTEEDTDGGRESQIRVKGEQSGGETTTLGYMEFSHEGTSDDQKGQFLIKLNDGDDDDAPSKQAIGYQSTGKIDVANSLSVLDEDDMASDDAECVPTQQSVKAFGTMVPAVTGASAGYAGEESVTFANGLIFKFGSINRSADNTTVTFGTAFPNGIVAGFANGADTAIAANDIGVHTLTTSSMQIRNTDSGISPMTWLAIGY